MKDKIFVYLFMFYIITFFSLHIIFKDNTIFDNYVRNIFPYIISGIILIYILLIIRIFISSKKLQKT